MPYFLPFKSVKNAMRIYQLFLMFYPSSYRRQFGLQMMQTFVDAYTDLQPSTRGAVMRFWLFTISDEIKNIARQHMAILTNGPRFLRFTLSKLLMSILLVVPLFGLAYIALVKASLALAFPSVSGIGFVIALAALLFTSGMLSTVTSYLLACIVLRGLQKISRA